MAQKPRPQGSKQRLADLAAIARAVPDAAHALSDRRIAMKLGWPRSRVRNALVYADSYDYLFAETPRGCIYLFSHPDRPYDIDTYHLRAPAPPWAHSSMPSQRQTTL